MTVDQIRTALDELESNYSMAMDCEDYDLARRILPAIDSLREALVELVCVEDPYTTEADVRYFEGL